MMNTNVNAMTAQEMVELMQAMTERFAELERNRSEQHNQLEKDFKQKKQKYNAYNCFNCDNHDIDSSNGIDPNIVENNIITLLETLGFIQMGTDSKWGLVFGTNPDGIERCITITIGHNCGCISHHKDAEIPQTKTMKQLTELNGMYETLVEMRRGLNLSKRTRELANKISKVSSILD